MDKKRVMALVLSTVMALSGAACSTPASKETAAAGTSSDSTVASGKMMQQLIRHRVRKFSVIQLQRMWQRWISKR